MEFLFSSLLLLLLLLLCRKDDGWKLSRGVYVFVSIGLLLLLGAISAVIVVIKPWTVSEVYFLCP